MVKYTKTELEQWLARIIIQIGSVDTSGTITYGVAMYLNSLYRDRDYVENLINEAN